MQKPAWPVQNSLAEPRGIIPALLHVYVGRPLHRVPATAMQVANPVKVTAALL